MSQIDKLSPDEIVETTKVSNPDGTLVTGDPIQSMATKHMGNLVFMVLTLV